MDSLHFLLPPIRCLLNACTACSIMAASNAAKPHLGGRGKGARAAVPRKAALRPPRPTARRREISQGETARAGARTTPKHPQPPPAPALCGSAQCEIAAAGFFERRYQLNNYTTEHMAAAVALVPMLQGVMRPPIKQNNIFCLALGKYPKRYIYLNPQN